MATITVTVKDSQPNGPKPELDLYFPKTVAETFHWKHNQPIEFVLDAGAPWHGTVGIKLPNDPYLHRILIRAGEKISMPIWLLEHGLAHDARVEVSQESATRFRWGRVLDRGKWPPGRAPKDRPTVFLRKASGIKAIHNSGRFSQIRIETAVTATEKGPTGGSEFYNRLWTAIRENLNNGVAKWQDKIIGFGQVAAVESREKGKKWSDNEIFEGVVKAILSSNTDWSKIERILTELHSVFRNFELNYYASLTETDVVGKIHAWFKERYADSPNLKQGLIRLTESSKRLLSYSKRHEGLDNFITGLLKETASNPKLLAFQLGSNSSQYKLPGMRIALAAEALRNIGFDIAKPDMHVNRATGCFGLVRFNRWSEAYVNSKGQRATRYIETDSAPDNYSSPEPSEAKCVEVMKTMEEFAKTVEIRTVFLDNAIWLLCANSGLHATNQELKRLALV
jgi:hypothetical protein